MVKLEGIYYSAKNQNKTVDFVLDSIDNAYQAIDYFFDYINIDKSLFNHLKQIPVFIDNECDNERITAYFIVRDKVLHEPVIHIVRKYINLLLDDSNRELSIKKLSWSIIHETIHCNRCIILNNLINDQDTNIVNNSNTEELKKEYNELEELLSIYYNPKKEVYDVLKVKYDDEFMDIYAYNEIKDSYELYIIHKNRLYNIFDINEINQLLTFNYNNNYTDIKPYSTIKKITKYNEEDVCMNFDYDSGNISVPFNRNSSIIERNKISLNEGIEEALTEAFSGIILFMNDNHNISFIDACNKLYILTDNYDIKLAIDFIKTLSIDDIRWFFLSCYMDEYDNRLKKIMYYNYERLLYCFKQLYEISFNEKEQDKKLYLEGRSLIMKQKNNSI